MLRRTRDDGTSIRHVEGTAHGQRWFQLAHARHFELGRPLVPQLSLILIDGAVERDRLSRWVVNLTHTQFVNG